jgi:hypothetical protein
MKKDKAEEGMGSDMLELVLRELLAEQQKGNEIIAAQKSMLSQMEARFKKLEENVRVPVAAPSALNTKPLEEIVKRGIASMQLIVDDQPKSVIRKVQVLLFPEHNTALYCKLVFGRWVFWLVVMLAITDIYKWAVHWSDNQKELQQQEQLNSRLAKPRILPGRQEGKEVRKPIDSLIRKDSKRF